MVITISGFDGVGKSTSVDLLSDRICNHINGRCVSIYEVNHGVEVYDAIEDLDKMYDELRKYDVIKTRFYLRSNRLQQLQEQLMFTDDSIFNDFALAMEVTQMAYEESMNWFRRVISRLIDEDKIIVYDRYWFDEVAYRSLYGIEPKIIEDLYADYLMPDYAFYLHGSLDLVKSRNANREDSKTALLRSSDKMSELILKFERLSVKHNMRKVDVGGKSRGQIVEEIFGIVKRECKGRCS